MDTKLQSVIDKIQKLRSLATSMNINEANAAANVANKLIEEYRLSEADIAANNPALDHIEEDTNHIYTSGKITRWKSSLVRVLAEHYGVTHWNNATWVTGRQVSRYRLIGRKSDMQIVNYMFAWLTLECERLSGMYAKGNGRVFVASWCEGFVAGIAEQLELSRA